jgi:hypothetical protein
MKKISEAIMVSIVPGSGLRGNAESVAMLGVIPLGPCASAVLLISLPNHYRVLTAGCSTS